MAVTLPRASVARRSQFADREGQRRFLASVSGSRVTGVAAAIAIGLFGCSSNELGYLSAVFPGELQLPAAPRGELGGEIRALCSSGPSEGSRRGIGRGPYLQQVTDRSARLLWVSSARAPEEVRMWPAEKPGDAHMVASVPDQGGAALVGTQRLADLTELKPAAVYCYQFARHGKVFGPVRGFRTAPRRKAESVRLIVFGDMGLKTGDQLAVLAEMRRADADLVLLTGDLAYEEGELGEFEKNFFSTYSGVMGYVPFFPSPGNHDYETDELGPYRAVFSLPENGFEERFYSFDWGPLHVVAVDTERLTDAQLEWLEKDLKANRSRPILLFGHRPPYSSGKHGGDGDVLERLVPILVRHRVRVAFFGHEHHYERTRAIDGTTYYITGGGGRGTRAVGNTDVTVYSQRVAHFLWVEYRDGALTVHAIDATGVDFDRSRVALPVRRPEKRPKRRKRRKRSAQ